jgi:hypothetical protein
MNARLEKLLLQRKQVEAKIKLAKERDRKRDRKAETRKKIVIGGYLLERMKRDTKLEGEVLSELEHLLKRTIDRELFGFEGGEGEGSTDTKDEAAERQPFVPSEKRNEREAKQRALRNDLTRRGVVANPGNESRKKDLAEEIVGKAKRNFDREDREARKDKILEEIANEPETNWNDPRKDKILREIEDEP